MSQAQFMKVLKHVAGMILAADVTRVRIINALCLLRATEDTITEIASRRGFPIKDTFTTDSSRFSKKRRAHNVRTCPEASERHSSTK
jgi:AraC-like DNA-binding protein